MAAYRDSTIYNGSRSHSTLRRNMTYETGPSKLTRTYLTSTFYCPQIQMEKNATCPSQRIVGLGSSFWWILPKGPVVRQPQFRICFKWCLCITFSMEEIWGRILSGVSCMISGDSYFHHIFPLEAGPRGNVNGWFCQSRSLICQLPTLPSFVACPSLDIANEAWFRASYWPALSKLCLCNVSPSISAFHHSFVTSST